MPGGGKSTVGRHLARHLNVRFIDADVEIEHRIGCPIRVFFEREGEARFRDLEEEVLADLTSRAGSAVLATGGGCVTREATRRNLRERTTVVYLRSTPEELFRRLRHDTHRPMLQVPDPLRKLRDLYTERDPLYRATAHFVIETGRPSVHSLVNMVLMQLELAGLVPSAGGPAEGKPAPKLGA
jgi:shikimate kinase